MRRRTFLFAAAAVPSSKLLSSSLQAAPLTPSQGLQGDFAVMRAAMTIHPGIHLHRSPREIAQAQTHFEANYSSAMQSEDLARAYLDVSRFLAALRCGHSYANFFNQDDPEVKQLFERPTRLPFWFKWIGDRMIVTHDPSELGLPGGTEVVELNGLPPRKVLSTLLPYTRGDGGNDGKRRSLLSVEGREDLETFDVFHGLLLPPTKGMHRLTIRLPDGRTSRLSCRPITLAERRAMMTRVSPETDAPRWQWERRPDGIAVLTMPGWAMWNSKWDWRSWLENRLDSLGNASGLIVDIRENEGGDDCGDPILGRLIDRPLSGWPFDTRLRLKRMPPILRQNSSTWDQSFYALGDGAAPLGGGFYRPVADPVQSLIQPSMKKIGCPVAILISPVNSSATFAFVNAARATGRVKLIGEATGGNCRGVNGGAFLFVKLPFSGIEFDLPLKGYVARNPAPDSGIEPDITAPVTIASLHAERDDAMMAAIQYCRSS